MKFEVCGGSKQTIFKHLIRNVSKQFLSVSNSGDLYFGGVLVVDAVVEA